MSENWDNEFGDVPVPAPLPVQRKWDDEDIDEDHIKESWEESEDEEKEEPKIEEPLRKKLTPQQRREERENAKSKIQEQKEEEEEEEEDPVKKKERLRQLEMEADLANTATMFEGIDMKGNADLLENINPKTKEEFEEFAKLLVTRIRRHEKQGPYANFINNLTRELCLPLTDAEVRKTASTLTNLANEKKAMKESSKVKKKGKVNKPFLTAGKAGEKVVDPTEYTNNHYDDEFDDFM